MGAVNRKRRVLDNPAMCRRNIAGIKIIAFFTGSYYPLIPCQNATLFLKRFMKITSIEFVKSATKPSQYPEDLLPEVAFVGRSNVGKSSLINTLVNRKRFAKTSSTPGRTRLVNFFRINNILGLVDLPGYGYAKVPIAVRKSWGPIVETYLEERRHLSLVVVILDMRREPSKDDLMLIDWLNHYGKKMVFVLTKSDKLSQNKIAVNRRIIRDRLEVTDEDLITFSAKTGKGKESVWNAITDVLN